MSLAWGSVLKLPPDAKGHPILDYLAARFKYLDRDGWRQAILDGRVTLDGKVVDFDTQLYWNGILEYKAPFHPEPEVSMNFRLVYANADYAVIDKPPNLPCHPAGGFYAHTLWAFLKEGLVPGLPPMETVHFVSRLDRETSGLVLIARTPKFHTKAMAMWNTPLVKKNYRVTVHGSFPDSLEANGWLFRDSSSAVERKQRFSYEKPQDVPSLDVSTSFRCLKRENGLSFLDASLHTGRYHQIRATLSSLGFPVLGDKLYGLDEAFYIRFSNHSLTADDEKRLVLPHQALNAYSLCFDGKEFFSLF